MCVCVCVMTGGDGGGAQRPPNQTAGKYFPQLPINFNWVIAVLFVCFSFALTRSQLNHLISLWIFILLRLRVLIIILGFLFLFILPATAQSIWPILTQIELSKRTNAAVPAAAARVTTVENGQAAFFFSLIIFFVGE